MSRLETMLTAEDAPVRGYTYRQLAQHVYDVEQPTPAQLSAIRRAVAVLVERGIAERFDRDWRNGGDGAHTRHVRRLTGVDTMNFSDGAEAKFWVYRHEDVEHRNPAPMLIRRARTPEERAQHEKAVATLRSLLGGRS